MEFVDRIYTLAARIRELKEHTTTEEATKNALVLPFLQALGYDTFDPRVVEPEFTADVGTKKGEKVDYAIKRDGSPVMLIEVKCCGATLDQGKANQLIRYFQATQNVRIGILTDGVIYKFFSDLDRHNMMDDKPFMVFDFLNVEEALIPELRKLANEKFDIEATLAAAQDLKHIRQLKSLLAEEMRNPSDELVRLFAKEVHSGQLRTNVIDDYREKMKLAFRHVINDVINERLQTAMQDNAYPEAPEEPRKEEPKRAIETTQEEWEAFYAVKSILREVVDPERVFIRDAASYCAVLLDDNNRKPVCRFHFNGKQKYVGLLDENKKETRHAIAGVDDLFSMAEALAATAQRY
ncbi:type I restriction endonuclease [Oleidesulfovibrio sp.]|uniref:type I restriction endonuclease n=1 Tax=Oleidesulfovibrio sp. TaxID=2909707 RepID=UPI003A84520B